MREVTAVVGKGSKKKCGSGALALKTNKAKAAAAAVTVITPIHFRLICICRRSLEPTGGSSLFTTQTEKLKKWPKERERIGTIRRPNHITGHN